LTRAYRTFCRIHLVGRDVGEAVPYDEGCRECVRRRGHLPPEERDQPGFTARDKYHRNYLHGIISKDPNKIIEPYRE